MFNEKISRVETDRECLAFPLVPKCAHKGACTHKCIHLGVPHAQYGAHAFD